MTYDPATYWRERGETYEAKFRNGRYAEQEAALSDVLLGLEFASVLEVGCGFGRIGKLIRDLRPSAGYTGIDLSPTMLESAKANLGAVGSVTESADGSVGLLIEASLDDFRADKRKYDLVIAVEMLMHVPPDDVAAAVRKLDRVSSKYIVTLDWTTPLPRMKTAAHNFLHDYVPLLGTGPFGRTREVRTIPVGLQTIHVVSK